MVGTRKAARRVSFLQGVLGGCLLVLLGTAGCAGRSVGSEEEGSRYDCMDLCEKGKEERCPGAEALRCEDQCLSEDFRVEGTGCRSERDDVLDCTGELDDICRVREDCDDEIRALWDCYRVACKDNDADYCTGVTQ
jgi:hypothetical protein